MVNRSELGLMLAALFSLFGRELTEVDVNAWHLVLGEFDRDELSAAILKVGRTRDCMPPASVVRRAVIEHRSWKAVGLSPISSISLRSSCYYASLCEISSTSSGIEQSHCGAI